MIFPPSLKLFVFKAVCHETETKSDQFTYVEKNCNLRTLSKVQKILRDATRSENTLQSLT